MKHRDPFSLYPVSLAILLMAIVFGTSLNADSIRINGKVVDTGMSKGKVFLIMGQPDWKSSFLIGAPHARNDSFESAGFLSSGGGISAYRGEFNPVYPTSVEEWLFNRGKNRFMQLLRFENERLVEIHHLGYGFGNYRSSPVHNPDWSTLRNGATTFELLREYGEPSLVEAKPEITFVRLLGPRGHPLYYHSADVEWWYYNEGPHRLFRIVKLLNGRVVDVVTEGYGLRE